jgi:hypothetical protein
MTALFAETDEISLRCSGSVNVIEKACPGQLSRSTGRNSIVFVFVFRKSSRRTFLPSIYYTTSFLSLQQESPAIPNERLDYLTKFL